MKNKRLLVATCVGLAIVCIAFICQSDDANGIDNVKPSQRTIDLNRGSLGAETWLEVEKNETVKICLDSKVRSWETSLNAEILNDSCLKLQIPTLVGVNTINVQFYDTDSAYKINLAVGMKYLDFKNEEVLLGYDDFEDTVEVKTKLTDLFKNINVKKLVSVSGSYLVDKYPVTNCEILQVAWDYFYFHYKDESVEWTNRKIKNRNELCNVHDTAAYRIDLFLAMKYANERSIREGLKPYYSFLRKKRGEKLESPNVIGYTFYDDPYWILVDTTSDGYRLPYYDEWMMFARGGDRGNAPWNDSISFYKFMNPRKSKFYSISEPVGLYEPNGYGLHDIFGLVEELVIFEQSSLIKQKCIWFEVLIGKSNKAIHSCPSCLKGGGRIDDNWQDINYGYYSYEETGGFRLIRNIGNNAKWSEVKSEKE